MSAVITIAIYVAILLIVFYFLRRTYSFFEVVVIVDIFLRVVNYLIGIFNLSDKVQKVVNVFPSSIEELINNLTTGSLNQILLFVYFSCFVIFIIRSVKRAI